MSAGLAIQGLQRAQAANLRLSQAIKPKTGLGRAVAAMLPVAHRELTIQLHVDAGALRAAPRIKRQGERGWIYIDPSARNPRSGQLVSRYALPEEERGGEHAAWQLTIRRHGVEIATAGITALMESIKESQSG